MKTQTLTQKGFTLVELAIVMTIIGLLIGGILKGQELMQTARVTSTVAQVKAFEAATTNFRDSFGGALPGDIANAASLLQGCTTGCNNSVPVGVTGTTGDNIVGLIGWQTGVSYATQALGAGTIGTTPSAAVTSETWLFWTHLALANLLSGVTSQSIQGTGVAWGWGVTHPAAKIAGGFIVGNTTGVTLPGSTGNANTGPNGIVLAIVLTPTSVINTTATSYPLSAARSAQIDRKMDDGRPTLGDIQAYGVTPSAAGGTGCMLTTDPVSGAAVNTPYNEAGATNACGIFIRIQG